MFMLMIKIDTQLLWINKFNYIEKKISKLHSYELRFYK